ncbi:MAG TPA: LacI family DNA-binding transcriptional regulator [Anaerolineaceae bacterium]|nr:LacI family DNA-binding transcriptional regulator [Anaerolineaceae bacterium]
MPRPTLPTIEDVAELAGVSIATVSRVVNGTEVVSAATARRVQEAIRQLGYSPHSAARSLASRRTSTLGLILPEISGPFFSPLLRGIELAAREAGLELLVYSTQNRSAGRVGGARPMGPHNTDGLLVFTGALPEEELAALEKAHFPMVLLHQSPPEKLAIPAVAVENRAGAHQVVSHLIDAHGCQRIAFLTGPEGQEDARWRFRGYCETLAVHNLDPDPALIGHGEFDEQTAFETVSAWIRGGLRPDAIFAADDTSAIGALNALIRVGLRVPEEVALVGFDDMDISRYLSPPLTTVRAPVEEVGRTAADQLIRLIQGQTVEPLILLPTELVVRRSCGCS